MNELNILRWIVIPFMKCMILVLSISHILPLLYKLLMCLLKLYPSTYINFLLTNWCFLIIQHLFEGGYQEKDIILKANMNLTREGSITITKEKYGLNYCYLTIYNLLAVYSYVITISSVIIMYIYSCAYSFTMLGCTKLLFNGKEPWKRGIQ